MGVVSSSTGRQEPVAPNLRSEAAIIAGIAKATLGRHSTVDWDALAGNYGKVRDRIARVIRGLRGLQRPHRQGDLLPAEPSARAQVRHLDRQGPLRGRPDLGA